MRVESGAEGSDDFWDGSESPPYPDSWDHEMSGEGGASTPERDEFHTSWDNDGASDYESSAGGRTPLTTRAGFHSWDDDGASDHESSVGGRTPLTTRAGFHSWDNDGASDGESSIAGSDADCTPWQQGRRIARARGAPKAHSHCVPLPARPPPSIIVEGTVRLVDLPARERRPSARG